ncbi:hypothetical protein H0O03_00070 [Candidatus Micrarchaeota archaeon]|nr:hypothetical protein [Candidatus Micrarchaeota archaeon]
MMERIDELEKALRRSRGRAVVLVHPRFHLSVPLVEDDPRNTPAGRKYLATQRVVIQKSKIPVIVFEEEQCAAATKKAFGEKVFIVVTEKSRPEPVGGWKLLELLKARGLKHGIFGGQRLSCVPFTAAIRARAVTETLELQESGLMLDRRGFSVYGCVPRAMREFLRRGLRISFMKNVVYPQKFV